MSTSYVQLISSRVIERPIYYHGTNSVMDMILLIITARMLRILTVLDYRSITDVKWYYGNSLVLFKQSIIAQLP